MFGTSETNLVDISRLIAPSLCAASDDTWQADTASPATASYTTSRSFEVHAMEYAFLLRPSAPVIRSALLTSAILLSACGGGGGGGNADASANTEQAAGGAEQPGMVPISGAAQEPSSAAVKEELDSYRLDPGTQMIESFDDYTSADGANVPNWTYIPGAEFIGASGSLRIGTVGSGSRSAILRSDLNCSQSTLRIAPTGCGKYVALSRAFASPLSLNLVDAPQVQVRYRSSSAQNGVTVRVVDTSGQTLQYALPPYNLKTALGDEWTAATVSLQHPASFFGGANNGQLQGSITGLSILSVQGALAGAAGNLEIDEIKLLSNSQTKYSLTGVEPVLSEGVSPSLEGRAAVTARYYKVSANTARLAREAGFSVVRVDMFWDTVEKNGSYDFTIYDRVLQRLDEQGLKALFILNYGHPDHGDQPATSQQRAAFSAYARAATRFAQGRNVVAFEIWNEPDNSKYWAGGDVNSYAQLLTEARQAIKAEDPSRKVINGGISWVDLPYIMNLAQTGALAGLDAFAIHPYRGSQAPETLATDVIRTRDVLTANGLPATIWNTEWGHSSYGSLNTQTHGDGFDIRARHWQAVMVLRSLLTQVAMNLPMITIYELYDTGTNATSSEANFGLLTATLEPKPAYNAVKRLHNFTRAGQYKGLLADTPPNLHAMKWDVSGRARYVVWADTNRKSYRLAVPRGASVTLWDGTAVSTQEKGQHIKDFEVNASTGPIFVSL